MGNNQDNRNHLQEIKLSALSIVGKLDSSDPIDVQNAMQEYIALVDRFYEGNEQFMAPQQYETKKKTLIILCVCWSLRLKEGIKT